ncbi:MAG: hypothetical protein IKI76_11050 [Selenomonadaceae bacterium]|nr:hypothetical protein [Selenomonadaceae bacterium]
MKFIATTGGCYINALYIRLMCVEDAKIILRVDGGLRLVYDGEFASDEAAQKYLDELIEELEDDERPDAI